MLKNFFTYKGRIGRKTYIISAILVWCATLLLFALINGGIYVAGGSVIEALQSPVYSQIYKVIGGIFTLTFVSFPVVKRLHDIKASGYFFLFLPAIVLLNLIFMDANGQIRFESLMWMKYVLSGLSWLSLAFILLIFKKGTEGPNAYGPDPLPAQKPNV